MTNLTDREREDLSRWARRHTTAQNLALRARIVVACAEGKDNRTVALECQCALGTVTTMNAQVITIMGVPVRARDGVKVAATIPQGPGRGPDRRSSLGMTKNRAR